MDAKSLRVRSSLAEYARVGLFLGGDDVGDLGEEGNHRDGEGEADHEAQHAQKDNLADPAVRDEAEECERDSTEEKAKSGGVAWAMLVDVHTNQRGGDSRDYERDENEAGAEGGPAE